MIQVARKPKRANSSIRKLRDIVGKTQAEFAVLVGVSTDAVISWENGRNRLSSEKARLIHVATGARTTELFKGRGQVRNMDGAPYAEKDFKDWHDTYLGATNETRADYFAKQGAISLWLIFHAAAKPGPGRLKNRLPAVWIGFQEWAEQAADRSCLRPEIKALQAQCKQWLKEQSAEASAILARGGSRGRIFRA